MKYVSIFISSTFQDMDLERDCLRRYVLPKLQEYFVKYGIDIQLIDLRWGITTSEEVDVKEKEAKILRSCFQMIDDCNPFFICFLGERYGWTPPEIRLHSMNEFADDSSFSSPMEKKLSVTQMEIEYGILLKNNYRHSLVFLRNEQSYNHLPPNTKQQYLPESEEYKLILDQRKEMLRKKFEAAGCSDHVKDYIIPLYANTDKELYTFIRLLTESICCLIKNAIQPQDVNLRKYIVENFLKAYLPPLNLLSIIMEDIKQGKNVLLYGSEGIGKTSFSLYLRNELIQKIGERIVLFHSADFSEDPLDTYSMVRKWTSTLCGAEKLALGSIEDEWLRFQMIVKQNNKSVIIIIDAYDALDLVNNNLFLCRNSQIQFIILSTARIKNWETFFSLKPYHLSGFSRNEVLTIIQCICKENGKRLDKDLLSLILDKRLDINGLYNPLDVKTIIQFILTVDKADFQRIRSLDVESEEDKITSYLAQVIIDTPHDIKAQGLIILEKVLQLFGEKELLPFKLIALSLRGLNEAEISNILGEEFGIVSFSLILQFFKPYLGVKTTEGKWKFAQESIHDLLVEFELERSTNKDLYQVLSLKSTGVDCFYYALLADNKDVIYSIYSSVTQNDLKECNKYISMALRKGVSMDEILCSASYRLAEHSTFIDRLVFDYPMQEIRGVSGYDRNAYFSSVSNFLLSKSSNLNKEDKLYLLGCVEMELGKACTLRILDEERKKNGIIHFTQAIAYLLLCDAPNSPIEYCRTQIKELRHV